MKKHLLLFCTFLITTLSFSQTFNDGILEYTVTDATNNYVSVNKYNNTCPTGDITIPETIIDNSTTYTITSIVPSAFQSCSGLTTITIPLSVASIGAQAFRFCSSLTNLVLPSAITSIEGGAFQGCSGLTNITIPSNVTSIGNDAFRSCTSLTNLVIPSEVTSIGLGSFWGCSGLTNITIPSSVISIGFDAFRSCTSLTSFNVNWNTPLSVSPAVFTQTTIGTVTLFVPSGTESAYQAAAVWQDFGTITLGINDFNSRQTLQLYPNPVKDILNIKLDNGTKLNQVIIFNALGQPVNTSKNLKINTSNLTSGIYFIEVETAQGKSTKKIIKE